MKPLVLTLTTIKIISKIASLNKLRIENNNCQYYFFKLIKTNFHIHLLFSQSLIIHQKITILQFNLKDKYPLRNIDIITK